VVKKKFDAKKFQGFRLDVGCGENKMQGFLGIDKRPCKGVDIVHDIEKFPWPLKDESVLDIFCSHVMEHIKPWLMLDLMNEMWRVMKPGGQLVISMPYGVSFGFVQDPTHCNACNEATWTYFDPRYPLWAIYKPQPWVIQKGFPQWFAQGNMEVLLRKVNLSDIENMVGKAIIDLTPKQKMMLGIYHTDVL
jgi:SAM-dependent methyltransferase